MALLDFLRRTPTIKRAVVINGITMELEIKERQGCFSGCEHYCIQKW